MALSPKRRKVIDHFMAGMNKKEAMLAAGYSKSMATTRANDVFGDPAVDGEIARRQKLAARRSDVTLDWIVERLKSIADANLGDVIDEYSDGSVGINVKKFTPELKRALTGLNIDEYKEGRGNNAVTRQKIRINLADKLRALELLVRHLGLSKEKQSIELSGELSLVERLHRGRTRAGIKVGNTDNEDGE